MFIIKARGNITIFRIMGRFFLCTCIYYNIQIPKHFVNKVTPIFSSVAVEFRTYQILFVHWQNISQLRLRTIILKKYFKEPDKKCNRPFALPYFDIKILRVT
jgi:hypothetical protein